MNNQSTKKLFNFITAAERSRKYMPTVAANHKTPLRLIDTELNQEEGESVEILKQNLEQIFHTFYTKNQSKISASSIEIYKRRLRSLIEDYENYGVDPSKMASWNKEISVRKTRKEGKEEKSNPTESLRSVSGEADQYKDSARNEIPLSNGRKVIIITPLNLDLNDVDKIDAFITYLKTISGGNPPEKKDEGKVEV